ncbi:MAG: SRPBCC family protein [Actinomycetota bacterium]|nr:SRPBCC family protein [Actinomycetota bacterium]
MSAPTSRVVSDSRLIAASPAAVFALISDPSRHREIDGSGMVQNSRDGARVLSLGSRFRMDMKMGPIPYRMSNTVVEFEQDRLIAWAHFGGHRWRYAIEEAEDGCLVTESFDWSTAKSPKFIELMSYPAKNHRAIVATLDRLERLFSKDA